jgi:hypothetical protein
VLRKSHTLPLLVALAGFLPIFFGCEKKQPASEVTPPVPATAASPRPFPSDRVTETSPAALLTTLHHAAQEMALDGFQFDRPELGWPFDRGSSSTADHLQSLVQHSYLDAADITHFAEIQIANLSDSDPGETAFAILPHKGKIHTIRKDGVVDSDSLPPPRDPAWLPRQHQSATSPK